MPNEAPPMPEVTLLQDLEDIAADEDEAAYHQYCDPGPHRKYAARASRIRAAANRLREEMELSRRRIIETYRASEAPAHAAWNLVDKVLRSVNAGPAPVSTPVVPREHRCPSCDFDDTVKVPEGKLLKSTPIVRPPTPVPGERVRSGVSCAEFETPHPAGDCGAPWCVNQSALDDTSAACKSCDGDGACRGCERTIPHACHECGYGPPVPGPGSGATCDTCHGAREVYFDDAGMLARGYMRPCPTCVQPNPGSGMGPAKPCRFCIRGRRIYASTATWRGGSGGQTATEDVCNRCWGSGDAANPGPDPRRPPPTPERKP